MSAEGPRERVKEVQLKSYGYHSDQCEGSQTDHDEFSAEICHCLLCQGTVRFTQYPLSMGATLYLSMFHRTATLLQLR
jgi:hypothetical protein